MGIAERKLRQREEVRNLILETAWEMVREEGWQALSIRKIADAIEYSVPVIYDHFENKEAILLEFGKQGFGILTKKLAQAKKKHDDPGAQLKAIADAYWQFAFNNKEYYQLMFGLNMQACETEKVIPERGTFRRLVSEPIEKILNNHHRTDVNACMKYHTFWSIIHGLVSIKTLATGTEISDEVNKMVLDDAMTGFIKNLER
ncbi:TetR/AcrR family transcriptional regulator [Flavihumibacter petaseus]|uniref:Putative TetR family transcriptional regulator n=1 Tax=Flavihumibacter petaseus NBRC 106054 TaxID=1220578 RepID=A0A0E9MV26_9BACT|nr:TetR/AcrR family transcriptional regulator [Flavihumibacter petaseus]GAO41414.1 putative TetR family transcriptional regulator [Flavihumibacter petaseus NBRC 106054]